MTPQELMDLPGYGSATKVLRKMGAWNDPREKMDKLIGIIDDAASEISTLAADIEDTTVSIIKYMEAPCN